MLLCISDWRTTGTAPLYLTSIVLVLSWLQSELESNIRQHNVPDCSITNTRQYGSGSCILYNFRNQWPGHKKNKTAWCEGHDMIPLQVPPTASCASSSLALTPCSSSRDIVIRLWDGLCARFCAGSDASQPYEWLSHSVLGHWQTKLTVTYETMFYWLVNPLLDPTYSRDVWTVHLRCYRVCGIAVQLLIIAAGNCLCPAFQLWK